MCHHASTPLVHFLTWRLWVCPWQRRRRFSAARTRLRAAPPRRRSPCHIGGAGAENTRHNTRHRGSCSVSQRWLERHDARAPIESERTDQYHQHRVKLRTVILHKVSSEDWCQLYCCDVETLVKRSKHSSVNTCTQNEEVVTERIAPYNTQTCRFVGKLMLVRSKMNFNFLLFRFFAQWMWE